MSVKNLFLGSLLALSPLALSAAEAINGDIIMRNSLCVGSECSETEEFGFATIKVKAPEPILLFDDTSNIGSFPNQDWTLGVTDEGQSLPANFIIKNVTNDVRVLAISPTGSVALGGNAELVDGAISVGSPGSEKPIVNVAEGTEPNDAVTVSQFNTFKSEAQAGLDQDEAELNNKIAEMDSRIQDLASRLEALAQEQ